MHVYEPRHEISNNVVFATSKDSDQSAQSDQSLCLSLEYSLTVKLLTEQHLEFLSLKRGSTGSFESTLVKMPHCWKPHVTAQLCAFMLSFVFLCHKQFVCKYRSQYGNLWRLTQFDCNQGYFKKSSQYKSSLNQN